YELAGRTSPKEHLDQDADPIVAKRSHIWLFFFLNNKILNLLFI
ncbi:hypothetical protein C5S29_13510, partial [ANME-1 cluster archaeon GoMg3.2]|nr:hypothetical protein [ANME-1 cluster archaeon GoMg3.2]